MNEIMEMEYPYQIKVHGEGETVKAQLPEPESVLELDGTIHLYLEK